MPLRTGSSNKIIKANISELIKAGYPLKKAVAIASSKAEKTRGIKSTWLIMGGK